MLSKEVKASYDIKSLSDVDLLWHQEIEATLPILMEEQKKRKEITTSSAQIDELDDIVKILPEHIDHTCLKPDATEDDIQKLCAEAVQWDFCTVCIHEKWVKAAYQHLSNTDVSICCVIDFPGGRGTSSSRVEEARRAAAAGAREFDVVINVDDLKAGKFSTILTDLAVLRTIVGPHERYGWNVWKLILETSQLTFREILAGCMLASVMRFDFVKTSTGFLGHGAKEEDVQLMLDSLGACLKNPELDVGKRLPKIKASGGIKTLSQAINFIYDCGVTRLGMSGSVALMTEATAAMEAATHKKSHS